MSKEMERTKTAPKEILAMSIALNRVLLAQRLGLQQYDGDRDMYQALGYKKEIKFQDYLDCYLRQDIAKAIIDRPVKATWQGNLELIESNVAKDTPFEKAWKEMDKKLGVKSILTRLDRLTGIGKYGVLLLGFDDVKKKEQYILPVKEGRRKLVYMKPLSETSVHIDTYDKDPASERYGLPELYSVDVVETIDGASSTIRIHYSRVLHIVDNALESEVEGTPRLQAVFNRLMDLEKVVGGDAEMYWRGARPGYQGLVDKDYTATDAFKTALKDQLDEYEHNVRRILTLEGIELKALAQQIADPSPHVNSLIELISAETGIPKRVLMGSERGELASSEDRSSWLSYVQARREDFAEPKIIRPLVDKLIEVGVLPKPGEEYTIKWIDLFSVSEKDRVDIGKGRAIALSEYAKNPIAIEVIPPDAFMQFFLGLDTEQITLINAMRAEGIEEELKDLIPIPNPPQEPSMTRTKKPVE